MKLRVLFGAMCSFVLVLAGAAPIASAERDAATKKSKSPLPVMLITCKTAVSGMTQKFLMADPQTRDLGAHTFLRGRIVGEPFSGKARWIPIDEIASMVEFASEQDAVDRLTGSGVVKGQKAGPSESGKHGTVNWRTNYNNAKAEASERQLPLLLFFQERSSALSQKNEREMFQSDSLVRLLNEKVVPLKLNAEEEDRLFHILEIEAPTLVVAFADGKIALQLKGYRDPQQLNSRLEQTLKQIQGLETHLPSGAAKMIWRKLGLRLRAIDPELVSRVSRQLHGGVEVTVMDASGVSSKAGIKPGDILVGLHNWEVLSLENVAFIAGHEDLATFQPLSCYYVRDGKVRRVWLDMVHDSKP